MKNASIPRLLTQILDIAKLMQVSGAEIYRIEDTVTRLLTAYGGLEPQVTAVPSHIIASARFGDEEYTLTRRVDTQQTDMELLDRLNNLSREICRDRPEPEEISRMLRDLTSRPRYTRWQNLLIYAFTCSMFTLFFGGSALDAAASAVVGAMLYAARCLFEKTGFNKVFMALAGSAWASFSAMLLVHAGLGRDADKIIIGAVMVLIPGIEMLNGFRDFISGDIQAGIMHLSESLFLAVIIAIGAAGMFTLSGYMGL